MGDSFAVAFEVPESATAEFVLRRIDATLGAPVILDGVPDLQAAIKAATAVYPEDGADAESLIRVAASRRGPRPPSPTAEMDRHGEAFDSPASSGSLATRDEATG
jgi:hypothetical protein